MVLILCGKSGSGKDAILKELEKSGELVPIVSDTTRPMREGEVDGISYNFLTKDQFLKKLNNGGYIEHREYKTLVNGNPDIWYYGCPTDDYNRADKDFVVIFDINGTKEFIHAVGEENVIVGEIVVDDDVREARARVRGSFDKTEWDRRLADDAIKFSDEEKRGVVDFTINNTYQILTQSVRQVAEKYQQLAALQRETTQDKKETKKVHTTDARGL